MKKDLIKDQDWQVRAYRTATSGPSPPRESLGRRGWALPGAPFWSMAPFTRLLNPKMLVGVVLGPSFSFTSYITMNLQTLSALLSKQI